MPIDHHRLLSEVAQTLSVDYATAQFLALRAYTDLSGHAHVISAHDDAERIASKVGKAMDKPAIEIVIRAAFYAVNLIRAGNRDELLRYQSWPPT